MQVADGETEAQEASEAPFSQGVGLGATLRALSDHRLTQPQQQPHILQASWNLLKIALHTFFSDFLPGNLPWAVTHGFKWF